MATLLDAHRTVVLTGGGTGGHITPILAVAAAIKAQDPTVTTVYIGERNGKFRELTDNHPAIDTTYSILAGKFRRYHGESWLRRLFDVHTNLLNLRDMFYFAFGTVQAWILIARLKPTIVFLKGGFVGVPVGLAAVLHRKQFITHDSDALPGLANRLVGRWAKIHAVAHPPETYAYPRSKTVQVGVLVEPQFHQVTATTQREFKQAIAIPMDATMLLITGGSSGARNINIAATEIVPTLLADYPDLYVVHQAGKGKAALYGSYQNDRLRVIEFMKPMYQYTGAADIVVSRASGNTVAELGVQGKAVIVVPNPLLAGGHQIKNAQALADQQAAVIVSESASGTDVHSLNTAIRLLIEDPRARTEFGQKLQHITITDAATRLAELLLEK